MSNCTYESWTIKDLTDALKNMHKDNKQIVVPMFQRGKRWKKQQEDKFIDSLKLGYPVGTMLFYKKVENNKEIYMLVEGLQRGNTIKKYLSAPTKYFDFKSIPNDLINKIYLVYHISGEEIVIKNKIRENICKSIKMVENVEDIEPYIIANNLSNQFSTDNSSLDEVFKILRLFIKEYKENYNDISKAIIPTIVYSGSEDSLQDIFERINSKGTPLTQYEVYAASWPIDKKIVIDNNAITDKILRKYDSLADDDYSVYGYDRDELRVKREVNAFEYLFGLSKYLNEDFKFLNFSKNEANDEINTMGFELVSACLNENRESIKTLYKSILRIDVIKFEKRLLEAVDFVKGIIAPAVRFKGNNRSDKSKLYSKFQILSMIAFVFREKYDISDLSVSRFSWNENKKT